MTTKPRQAFTLIEMLVVVSIMLALSAIVVGVSVRNGDRKYAQDGADRISGWLLLAKQWALRDQAPRGLRLWVDPNPASPTFMMVLQLQYIEQPDPWVAPGGTVSCTAGGTAVIGSGPVDFTGGFGGPGPNNPLWPVQPNDVIEMGSGANMQAQILTGVLPTTLLVRSSVTPPATGITGATPNFPTPGLTTINSPQHGLTSGVRLALNNVFASLNNTPFKITVLDANSFYISASPGDPYLPGGTWSTVTSSFSGTNWRIVRQPRPRSGEAPLTLPPNVVVDLSASTAYPGWAPTTLGPGGTVDILFTPSGAVVGSFPTDLKLWVRDTSVPQPQPGNNILYGGEVFIVTVSLRTGLISVHPADRTLNTSVVPNRYLEPYSFTKDGRASGL